MRALWHHATSTEAVYSAALVRSARNAVFASLMTVTVAACASSSAPAPAPAAAPQAAPAQAAPVTPAAAAAPQDRIAAMLQPPEGAVRAAATTRLTGQELGTMWTFENAPVAQWRERHNFDATPQWLEKVRLSSVRYGESCSASFVSSLGLVMTNHHCARECIEAVSTEQTDFVVTGFQARTRDEERVCPDLFLDQLVAIEDVTARVRGAAPAGAPDQQVAQAQGAEMQRIEQECEQRTSNQCQVVALFQGGQFQLYTYKRYQPVKLVFAPELDAGFFGGDPDNFTYPRYALDVSFVRAYQPDGTTPASTPNFFAWDADGAAEDELVFITGNPGSTSRLITLAQLMYERSYRHPFLVALLSGQRRLLQSIAAMGPEMERAVREDMFSVENSLKAYTGELDGLQDTALVATKIVWEREFRERANTNAGARPFLDVWDKLADLQRRKIETSPVLNAANAGLIGAPHFGYAQQLVAYVRALATPQAQRPPALQGQLQQLEQMLSEPSDIPEAQSVLPLELHLELISQFLPPGHPLLTALIRPGEQPAAAAQRLHRSTRVLDAAYRRALIAAGAAALDTISDPVIRTAIQMDSIYDLTLPRWQSIQAEETVQKGRLAQALFAVYGTQLPPDATFTLRISDGVVSGYPYNGTIAPSKTTIFGLYARAAEFNNQAPFTLPAAFDRARGRVDMSKGFNFVSTNDITGGNSGSPMIDRNARIVGIAFDGNIEQLPNQFVFRTEAGRTVAVHSSGILEALRNVYQVQALVDELLAGAGSTP
jgi:hypothetical protein